MANHYTYTALAGDTFDAVALDFYGQESMSSTIITANPDYRKTIIFSGGEQLKIPILSQAAANTLPPWKKAGT